MNADLFDRPFPWLVEPKTLFAQVVLPRPVRTVYTYAVPESLFSTILPGKRVIVPFGRGNKTETGYCVGLETQEPVHRPLKWVEAVPDALPLLTPSMLRLTRWMADYYFAPWGQVLDAVLPRGVKDASGTKWTWELSLAPEPRPSADILSPKQNLAFEVLSAASHPILVDELSRLAKVSPAVLRGLVQKGIARATKVRTRALAPSLAPVERTKPLLLTEHQHAAYRRISQSIESGIHAGFLLHGVTGSGKTEVYLQSIADAVARRREAIVLVPEISLTPQTIERFRQRFDSIAVLHSHLTDVERHQHWQRIREGQVQVVIGARSALFAPCRNLGIIIIDEEHETTFKQETTPRYHAREVALERGRLESVPVVFGSATPSLESWVAAQRGEIILLSLPNRVSHMSLPTVQSVDLRQEYRKQRALTALGPTLVAGMRQCLDAGGQIILLLNRRGFAPSLVCPQCGHVERCPHCDISLTFHKHRAQAVCHSCDLMLPAPSACNKCGHKEIRFTGYGTERLEDEVKARFPGVEIARMDSDTMRSPGHYEAVLSSFRSGITRILLGTQMIAKGLDFPNVRLVGVVSADTARNLPDFRSSEKTFQLIVQVSGRAGRGTDAGKVFVQTFNPEDPVMLSATRGDYLEFVRQELPERQMGHYPPFACLTRVIVRALSESAARDGAKQIAERLKAAAQGRAGVIIKGPAPAPVTKLRDYFRFHLQLHTPDVPTRSNLLELAFENLTLSAGTEFAVDVDPMDLL